MKLIEKDYEEILTIIAQCKALIPSLSYNEGLDKKVFEYMKDKKQPDKETIQKSHNNYLALTLIGINNCNTETYKKLNQYMDEEY